MKHFSCSKLNLVIFLFFIFLVIFAVRFFLNNSSIENSFQNIPLSVDLEVLGNKNDLISFSILPNSKVSGVVAYQGIVKGGYFFEGNILINILDKNKNVLKQENATATTEWMTSEPVSFEGDIDLTGLPTGSAYFEIHNDNASDLPENDKSILIPIILE